MSQDVCVYVSVTCRLTLQAATRTLQSQTREEALIHCTWHADNAYCASKRRRTHKNMTLHVTHPAALPVGSDCAKRQNVGSNQELCLARLSKKCWLRKRLLLAQDAWSKLHDSCAD